MSRLLRLAVACFLTASGFTSLATSAHAEDDCPPGYHKVGEDIEETATETIIRSRCKKNAPSPAAQAAARYCKARGLIANDQEGLRALDFESDVAQYEKFQEIASDQKASFEHKVFDAVLDQSLEAAEKGAESVKSLNPWNVNTAIKKLKAKGYSNDALFSAMRNVAAAKDKPARVEAYKVFVKHAKALHEGVDAGVDMAHEPDNANLRLALGALKIMQGNPELGLIVTGAEFGESFAYLYYLNDQIAEKDALSDQKLSSLAKLSDNMKKHVSQLQKAKTDWHKAGGQGEAPSCP